MGLYKHPQSSLYWCRFKINGQEIRKSTRTPDRRAAQVEERRLRAYYESKAPRRRPSGIRIIADLGGLDGQRAAAEGATADHIEALEWQWLQIVKHFGADTDIRKVYEYKALEQFLIARRAAGATDTVRREYQALKRGEDLAHKEGWLPFKLERWPRLGDTNSKTDARKGRVHPPSVIAAWLDELKNEARDAAEVVLVTWLRDAELHRMLEVWVEPAPDGSGLSAIVRVPAHARKTRRKSAAKELVRGLDDIALAAIKRRISRVDPGTPLFPAKSYKTAFRLARNRIGYKINISMRDLRKTGATWANQRVGLDAARDGLGHSNIATTQRYIGADSTRSLAGSAAVSLALGRHRKSGTGGKMAQMERAKGLEPSTLSLGSQLPMALDHVSTCKICLERVLACANLRVIEGEGGTGEVAQAKVNSGALVS